MSKPVKAMITAELRERYAGVESACVVELAGMDVPAQERLRKTLRKKSASLQVVKNSLALQAFKGTSLAPLGAALEGPCALITSTESLIDVARLLVEAGKEFAKLKLKLAILDGDPNLVTVHELSKMRGRLEILGELAMLISSPGRAVAGCIRSPQAKIAGCLKTIAERAA